MTDRPPQVLAAMMERQKAKAELEYHVGRIYALCEETLPTTEIQLGRETRSQGPLLTMELVSPCQQCNGTTTSLTYDRYLQVVSLLPFLCEHGHQVKHLNRRSPRTVSAEAGVNIPTTLQSFFYRPTSSSAGSSITVEKLDRYGQKLTRLESEFKEKHTNLEFAILEHRVNTDAYPEY